MVSLAKKWDSCVLIAGMLVAASGYAATANLELTSPTGKKLSLTPGHGKVTIVIFVSTKCPMSNAFNFRINNLYNEFRKQVQFIVLDSNVDESLEAIQLHAKRMEYDFPVYRDIDNRTADLLGAQATPDSFVIDRQGKISYHGYIEDSPNAQRSKNRALLLAIEAALAGRPAPVAETHGRGCAIRRTNPLILPAP